MPQQIDHVVRIAGAQVRVDERVQLAILGDEPLGADGHIAIVEPAGGVGLDAARP